VASLSLAAIQNAKTLVIKIGSSLLIEDGQLNSKWVSALIDDIAACHDRGQKVVLVSSGAVALGRAALNVGPRPLTLEESQAAAAAGQIALAHGWQSLLEKRQMVAAQILLTVDDTEQRRRYLNARATLKTLLQLGAVPIINENDTVATQELRYGDNDRLAARVASMVGSQCLVLLSDIDGLYRKAPEAGALPDPEAHIEIIEELTSDILDMAGDAGSPHGSGGMKTKLEAARIAGEGGCDMVLASGKPMRPIKALENGARSTFFKALNTPYSARKSWIAGALTPTGRLKIDSGASSALASGRSLLPVGLTKIEGTFERGDCVLIIGPDNREIGRGLCAYSSDDTHLIAGKQSAEIQDILGYIGRSEVIHRDDLVLNKEEL